MRLKPVRSIFLGLLVFFVVFLISESLHRFILLFLSFFLGGFIVMYFAREKKLQYLFYEGILILIFSIIMYPTIMPRLSVLGFIYLFLFILIFTGIGGFIGKKLAEKNIWSFNPVISVILGLIVSYIILFFIGNLTLLVASDSVFQQIGIVESTASLVVGGFIATFFAKEKKIQYGIYVGIIWMVLIGFVPSLIFGLPTSLLNLVITVLMYIGFIIAPTAGSYLAIIVAEHQKLQ